MIYTSNQSKKKTHRLFHSLSAFTIAGVAALAFAVPSAHAVTSSNLLTNGGFEDGSIAPATSDYTLVTDVYQNSLGDPTTYAVGTDPNLYHSAWTSFTAQEGTKMMVVNAADTADKTIWKDAVPVTAGHTYKWEAYVRAAYADNPAQLAFSVNGDIIPAMNTTVSSTSDWVKVNGTWTAPTGVTSADLTIVDTLHAFNGDDFALDGITFTDTTISRGKTNGDVTFMAGGTKVWLELEARGKTNGARGEVEYRNSAGERFRGKVTGYFQEGNKAYIVGEVTRSNIPTYKYFYVAVQDNGQGRHAPADKVLRVLAGSNSYAADTTQATGSYDVTRGNIKIRQ